MSRVSVALCTYNGEDFLPAQLESLARQTRLPDELVVTDDRSKDGTLDILRRFAEDAPFEVRIEVNDPNLGMVQNFGKAVSLCTGDVIFLCDHDDAWMPEKIARMERALLDDPAASMLFADSEVVDHELRPLGFTMWEAIRFGPAEQRRFREDPFSTLFRRNVVTGSASCFRASVRDVALPIAKPWVHDAWLAVMAAAAGDVVPYAWPSMRYRQHGRNAIGATRRSAVDEGRERARHAARDRAADFAQERDRWDVALRQMRAARAPRADRVERVAHKVAHLSARASLPPSRTARVGPVMAELRTGRYGRYSAGVMSAMKDVLLR